MIKDKENTNCFIFGIKDFTSFSSFPEKDNFLAVKKGNSFLTYLLSNVKSKLAPNLLRYGLKTSDRYSICGPIGTFVPPLRIRVIGSSDGI